MTITMITCHRIGQVSLVCNYDMEGDKLYSVKWWVRNSFLSTKTYILNINVTWNDWFETIWAYNNFRDLVIYQSIIVFIKMFAHCTGIEMVRSSTDTFQLTRQTQQSSPTLGSMLMYVAPMFLDFFENNLDVNQNIRIFRSTGPQRPE